MKKLKTQIIIFTFLAVASVTAYSYISMVTPIDQPIINTVYSTGDDTPEEQDVYLPDVEIVNRIIEAGKKLKAFGL